MTKTVLILGASGKIGSHAAEAFALAGWTVRKFQRGKDDMAESARGQSVIVNGFNPPGYKNWATLVPRYTKEVIAAAKSSGATVIVPANVYVYGDHPGTWDESTPHRATTRKGRIRIEMEAAYREAAKDGVRSILLRAGDFLDPRRDGTMMSAVVLRQVSKGRLTTLGDPSVRRSHCYLPDWARAAVMLAEMRSALEAFEDIPFPGHTFSIAELAACAERVTGTEMEVVRFPWWSMYLVAPFWRTGRELLEMRYLFELNHQLGARRFRELLPDFRATASDVAMLAEFPDALRARASVAAPC